VIIWATLFIFIAFKIHDGDYRYYLPGIENPIYFARYIGVLIFIILYVSFVHKINSLFSYSSIIIGLYLLYMAGSRGPSLALIICSLFAFSFFVSKKKIIFIIFILLLITYLGFSYSGNYLFETNLYSIHERLDLFEKALHIDNYFIGSGIGSYGLKIFGFDYYFYPHNIFLELLFENGLIGLLLLLVLIFRFFFRFKLNLVSFLCVYCLLVSMPSGDIPGNNMLFIALFVATYIPNSKH